MCLGVHAAQIVDHSHLERVVAQGALSVLGPDEIDGREPGVALGQHRPPCGPQPPACRVHRPRRARRAGGRGPGPPQAVRHALGLLGDGAGHVRQAELVLLGHAVGDLGQQLAPVLSDHLPELPERGEEVFVAVAPVGEVLHRPGPHRVVESPVVACVGRRADARPTGTPRGPGPPVPSPPGQMVVQVRTRGHTVEEVVQHAGVTADGLKVPGRALLRGAHRPRGAPTAETVPAH